MKFTKQQLLFLKLYLNCSDTESFLGDKINIKCDNKNMYFTLYGTDTKLITTFVTDDEPFENNYYISKLANLINVCNDNETIVIEKDLIKFGTTAEYKLERVECNIDTPLEKYLEMVEQEAEKKYTLMDINRIYKTFISNTNEDYKVISLQNNHFVTYNDTVLAIASSNNTIQDVLYFSPSILMIADYLVKEEKVNVGDGLQIVKLQEGEFYGITCKNINIFVEIKNSKLPYIFDEKISSMFNHKTKVSINTNDFKNALKRIDLLTRDNIESRVYFVMENGQIRLESRDAQKGYEIVPAKVDKKLEGFTTILNASYLNAITSFLKNFENTEIHITNSEKLTAVKITGMKDDGTESDFYFVHQVYEDIEFKR
jgi:hypothetical protein